MSSNTEQEGQEGQQTTDKLDSKVLIVVRDKPLSEEQQNEKEHFFDSNTRELTPIAIGRTSSCSHTSRSSISILNEKSSKIKERLSKLSISSLWKKSSKSDINETPTTIIDENTSNKLIKKRFRSLQNLSISSKLNNKLFVKDWCCKAIMDKARPKVKPKETSSRGITRSSLLSASDIGSKVNIGSETGSISSTSSAEYGSELPDIPVRFVWDHGGETVHVCVIDSNGSKTTVPLTKNDKNTSSVQEGISYAGVWETVVNLKPGRCEFRYAIDGDWTHDADLPALKNDQGHYNNMIKIKPSDNPFDTVVCNKSPNPENVSRGLAGFVAEHRPFKKKLKRCLSGDETLVLSDAENILSQSETLVDTIDANDEEMDDLLSGSEDLLPPDPIVSLSSGIYFNGEFGNETKRSVFLTEIDTTNQPVVQDNSLMSAKQVDSLLLISARQVESSLENIGDASTKTSSAIKSEDVCHDIISPNPTITQTGLENNTMSESKPTAKIILECEFPEDITTIKEEQRFGTEQKHESTTSGLVLPDWHPQKASSRSSSAASGHLKEGLLPTEDACEETSIHSTSSIQGGNTLNQRKLSTSTKGIKRSSLKTAEEIIAISRSSSRASRTSADLERKSESKTTSGLVIPHWHPRRTSSRGSSRASGDYKAELLPDDVTEDKMSIQSTDSTQSENKGKDKKLKVSKRGIKMSMLKTAEQIGAKFRSSSRASAEYKSISEFEETSDKPKEDRRHLTGAQKKSGLVRKGSVKVTDLDAYMEQLERKSMSKSTKDIGGNEESMPDLEEITVGLNIEAPITTTNNNISDNTFIAEASKKEVIDDTANPELLPPTEVKIIEQSISNTDAQQTPSSEDVVKKLVIPKYLDSRSGKKDSNTKASHGSRSENTFTNQDYTCHYSCTTIPIVSQAHDKAKDIKDVKAASSDEKECVLIENEQTQISVPLQEEPNVSSVTEKSKKPASSADGNSALESTEPVEMNQSCSEQHLPAPLEGSQTVEIEIQTIVDTVISGVVEFAGTEKDENVTFEEKVNQVEANQQKNTAHSSRLINNNTAELTDVSNNIPNTEWGKKVSTLSCSAAHIIKSVIDAASDPDPKPSGYKPFLFQSLYDDDVENRAPTGNTQECLIKKHKKKSRSMHSPPPSKSEKDHDKGTDLVTENQEHIDEGEIENGNSTLASSSHNTDENHTLRNQDNIKQAESNIEVTGENQASFSNAKAKMNNTSVYDPSIQSIAKELATPTESEAYSNIPKITISRSSECIPPDEKGLEWEKTKHDQEENENITFEDNHSIVNENITIETEEKTFQKPENFTESF